MEKKYFDQHQVQHANALLPLIGRVTLIQDSFNLDFNFVFSFPFSAEDSYNRLCNYFLLFVFCYVNCNSQSILYCIFCI